MGKFIVTIAREYGSGGRTVAQLVAKKLGVSFYDNKMLERTAEESGLAKEVIAEAEQKKTNSFLYSLYMNSMELPISDKIFIVQSKIIRQISEQESAVIVGRCADYVLSEYSPCIRVFLHAPLEERVKRAVEEYGVSSRNPQFTVIRKDKDRSSYYNYFTDKKWGKAQNYDIALSTSIGLEECADIIVKYVKTVIGKEE